MSAAGARGLESPGGEAPPGTRSRRRKPGAAPHHVDVTFRGMLPDELLLGYVRRRDRRLPGGECLVVLEASLGAAGDSQVLARVTRWTGDRLAWARATDRDAFLAVRNAFDRYESMPDEAS